MLKNYPVRMRTQTLIVRDDNLAQALRYKGETRRSIRFAMTKPLDTSDGDAALLCIVLLICCDTLQDYRPAVALHAQGIYAMVEQEGNLDDNGLNRLFAFLVLHRDY